MDRVWSDVTEERVVVGDRSLTFRRENGWFIDSATGSQWSITGRAVAGPLTGAALSPVVHGNHFWFAIAAFKPSIKVWRPSA